jgi:predicted transcriptional regulator
VGEPGPTNTEDRILRFVQLNPGRHLRKIKENMGVSMGTAQYHLEKLERMGRVVSIRRGLYKLYFPVGIFHENEKEILRVLSQETSREILLFIIEEQAPTQTEIVNRVGISAATVSWYVKRLIEYKLIDEIKEGRYKRYRLRNRESSSRYITILMRNYYPNIWDKWSSRLVETFLSLSRSDDK